MMGQRLLLVALTITGVTPDIIIITLLLPETLVVRLVVPLTVGTPTTMNLLTTISSTSRVMVHPKDYLMGVSLSITQTLLLLGGLHITQVKVSSLGETVVEAAQAGAVQPTLTLGLKEVTLTAQVTIPTVAFLLAVAAILAKVRKEVLVMGATVTQVWPSPLGAHTHLEHRLLGLVVVLHQSQHTARWQGILTIRGKTKIQLVLSVCGKVQQVLYQTHTIFAMEATALQT